jgi:hypothetical protein
VPLSLRLLTRFVLPSFPICPECLLQHTGIEKSI